MEQLAINTIRTLSIDAVQAAKSGHPGTPMALAPLVYTIWNRVMRFDPEDPIWPDRDRFVLSNGHASMLLWSILHLTQVKAVNANYERLGQPSVSLEDIRRFRQLDSKAPGHPEYHWVSGVETTTGPLGQGVATSVGMAVGQKWLANRFNRPGFEIFDYNIYAVCGDGCMMEGVASEAASLAGHLALDNLCWIYDNNHITIEGNTNITFTEDIAARFLGYGWNVLRVGDANDVDRIEHAFEVFRQTKGRPTFIILDSHIGYGSPNRQDTPEAHGEPLSVTRKSGSPSARMDGPRMPNSSSRMAFMISSRPGSESAGRSLTNGRVEAIRQLPGGVPRNSRLRLTRCSSANFRAAGIATLPVFPADAKGIAGREASGKVLNVLARNISVVPRRIGGSRSIQQNRPEL